MVGAQVKNDPPGTPDTAEAIRGELLGTFAELKSRYQTTHLELVWDVLSAPLKHVEKHEGIDELVEFSAKAGDMFLDDAKDIRETLKEDHRNRMH